MPDQDSIPMIVMMPWNKAVPIAVFNNSIHEVKDITGFKSITMKQIEKETATDVQLEELKKYIIQGFP